MKKVAVSIMATFVLATLSFGVPKEARSPARSWTANALRWDHTK
jgi:hypothetical protein